MSARATAGFLQCDNRTGAGMEKRIAFPLTAASLLAAVAIGQTVTGSIVGSVAASRGLPVATAAVKLVHAATGASRATVTDERGDFVFDSLTPCAACDPRAQAPAG